MTEGVNKEQVKGVEIPIENKIEPKPVTKGVAWWDVVVVLLFFVLFVICLDLTLDFVFLIHLEDIVVIDIQYTLDSYYHIQEKAY